MKQVTNKYERIKKDDDRYLNPHFDIKDVSKRIYQLGLATLFTGIALSIYTAFIGLYVSSFTSACFCFAILLVVLLKYHGDIENLTLFLVIIVSAMLIATAAIEGLRSNQYLYFFPLMVSVPIIVDLKQTQYKESFIYTGIIIVSFIAAIIIGHTVSPLENFTPSQLGKLSFVNSVIAISSTIVFAVAYIFFEKKYIKELVAQSNKVIDARTQFLATMGHELRTPLNGIIGVVNLLKQQKGKDTQQEEHFEILKYCSDHMLQQVNNILDFNKIEADKLEIHPAEMNLKQFLLNVGMPFITLFQEKGVALNINIDPELDRLVLADDVRLIQIFNNLFSNALKFTDTGYVKLDAVLRKKNAQHIEVGFSIEDTGIGIAESDQKKIFDSFWQVYDEDTKKFVGTGLGLTICVRLVNLMGGSLKLVSEKGKGSTFSFDLRFDNVIKKQQAISKPNTPSDDLAGIKILLVEDNQINMMVAKKILTGFKAEVSSAYNGKEALDALAQNANYDIILMDLEMPIMNGFTAILEIKKLYPHLPVIAFTASLVDQNMLSDLVASGFSDCMLKPFQPLQLLSNIKKYLVEPSQILK